VRLIRPDELSVRAGYVARRTAAISIDVESDYNSRQYEALGRLDDLLTVVRELDVPLTAFVEGQFFENRPAVCARLLEAGADVQLHCYDHLGPGDGPADLARSVRAYERFVGRRPTGYRAHTYRLTPELYRALVDEGFDWDSSVLPGLAQGGNFRREFRAGDYFVLDDRLVEFPVATWPRVPIPLIHSYRLMVRPVGEAILRGLFGYPKLIVYDMHMADLVWSGSLRRSPLPAHVRLLYRYMWAGNRPDSFGSLRRFVAGLRRRGYRFQSLESLHREVRAAL
jgi:peptidoglycan/xylan/chitin deacetylase (PgdA/CDA1 family)